MTQLLIVTAVEPERDAVCRHLDARGDLLGWQAVSVADTPLGRVTVLAGGVGPAASAASTAAALANAGSTPFDLVLSAGIAGGFDVEPGGVVSATQIVFADLGAETPGFESASELGFGHDTYPVSPQIAAELAQRTRARLGSVLTVSTVTGTAATAALRRGRHPDARAEAMEGAGVAAAAVAAQTPVAELRTISNLVGPRDRSSWRIPQALDALAAAVRDLTSTPLEIR
ncbi:futalosine hydrolase [Jatrophihabitans sp. GAS493]|uniref:futalosine hydrolase n=1 Tax=Jatrophihabitans sp. GAS493 TaxID=1907575 RepID=UPI000BC02E45|nr:futalosine hydrolase [Jatrophihabitans sp. GAS493]SOD70438.1 futalosine hydrolase [Jatrophihabitans sp. GAS493]